MEAGKLGNAIRTARIEKLFSQEELADKMNVTDKAVSKWERNISCPDINCLPTLAEILEISVEDLLNTTKKESKKEWPKER